MPRRVFYSFHYKADSWRASKIRNIGAIDGNKPASDNDWESVTKGGDTAIRKWIDDQMIGRTCTVVLVGAATAGRKWIDYEIEQSWKRGMGLLGIYIHRIGDRLNLQASAGDNPFAKFTLGQTPLDKIVKCYMPSQSSSADVYAHIASKLEQWIDDAIAIRNKYPK